MSIPYGTNYPDEPWLDRDGNPLDVESDTDSDALPRLWRARDLKPSAPPRWLAKGRLPQASISLLVGDEGIGKSLLWVYLAGAVTTGKALPEFGVPTREPRRVLLVCTEDDWQSTVRPRLEVVGTDLDMVDVICVEDDGSGAPVFPRDMHLIARADPAPGLIVVDAWLDTVAAGLPVRDPQKARQALHPWREIATATDAAVLLICHTNRVASATPRDRYGATGELRKKARMTLYAQADESGLLVVGPEKMNTAAPVPASMFSIQPMQVFDATDDHDGTVPKLVYEGESKLSVREHLAASIDTSNSPAEMSDALEFVVDYLRTKGGEAESSEILDAGEKAGFKKQQLTDARRRSKNPGIGTRKASFGGGWVWAIEGQDRCESEDGSPLPEDGEGGSEDAVPANPPSWPSSTESSPLCPVCRFPAPAGRKLHFDCEDTVTTPSSGMEIVPKTEGFFEDTTW